MCDNDLWTHRIQPEKEVEAVVNSLHPGHVQSMKEAPGDRRFCLEVPALPHWRLWPQKAGLCTPTCSSIREVGTVGLDTFCRPSGPFLLQSLVDRRCSASSSHVSNVQGTHFVARMTRHSFCTESPESSAPASFPSGFWGDGAALATQVRVHRRLCPWESHFRSVDVMV